MKKLKIFLLSLFVATGMVSCEEESDVLTGDAVTGGLVQVQSKLVGYVVGNGNKFKYSAKLSVNQADIVTSQIEVYKVFNNVAGGTSNEVLLKTVDVPTEQGVQNVEIVFTYEDLISGLLVNNNPISTDDSKLNIGDAWTLKYVAVTSKANKNVNAATTKVAVGTRFAGKYKVVESTYWRIGVNNGDWNDDERIIESVDATTYKMVGYAGPFANVTNTHYFTIDGAGVVRTPTLYKGAAQLLNGWPVINCEETPTAFLYACGVTGLKNTVVKDDVNGKDRIYRSYGYLTGSGAVGPREFYEVLEKVVE